MSNNAVATTGPQAYVQGSNLLFQAQPWNNGLPWDLTGGSGTLWLTDPTGTVTSLPVTISGFTISAAWTVVAPSGTWLRCWDLTDAGGVRQLSEPLVFEVTSKSG